VTAVHLLDPLNDPRWDELVDRHPRASVFHSRGWLEALKRTYGHEPIVLTSSGQGPLTNGLVLCRVRSWRSKRCVSLPFSDHCEPLLDRQEDLPALVGFLIDETRRQRWHSIELRPRFVSPDGLSIGASYCLHTLDLAPPAERIFGGLHPSCARRAIRRAEREGLTYEAGSSERLLSSFYGLLRLTRRRHGLPPQPLTWFRNLIACLGDGLTIHVASRAGLPIAAILTLSFKKTMVYKYGGSDVRHHRLGSVPFLFWCAIQDAKARGLTGMDLGRSALDQPGLIAFKDHMGASRTTLTYYTWPAGRTASARAGSVGRAVRWVVGRLPDAVLDFSGRVLYRHLG
jgi:Acetyltransferase (GNAT) domain